MNPEESSAQGPDDDAVSPANHLLPPELLESIPEEEREEFARKLDAFGIRIIQEERYSGPLQPASEAERWEALVPGAAERNFNLYESQQHKHMETQDRLLAVLEKTAQQERDIENKRHNDNVTLTKTELKNNYDKVRRGQWFAIGAMTLLTLGGFVMVHLGHNEVGIAAFVVEGIGVAKYFLYEPRSKTQDDTEGKPSAQNRSPFPKQSDRTS